jgi:hypothetical protein
MGGTIFVNSHFGLPQGLDELALYHIGHPQ